MLIIYGLQFHDQEIIRNAQRLGKIRQLALAKK